MSQKIRILQADGRVLMEDLEPRVLFSAAPTNTAATNAAVEAVAQANNAFAFNLFTQLSQENPGGNVFFSPYSAATALEMALQGAKGVTASEMIQALGLPSSNIAQAGIAALYQMFQPGAIDGVTLSTANRLWVNQNFPLLQSFIDDSQNAFGAAAQNVDFSDPDGAAQTINNWVSQQTDGKITNLISPNLLNNLTALVITNAVYFKGNWASAFNSANTYSTPFETSALQSSLIQMMQQTGDFGYYSQGGPNGFQAVDLPYQGNAMDMLVILPTSDNLDQFQSTLTGALFSQITDNLYDADVNLNLPRFGLNETYNLNQPLMNLGIRAAFKGADFSGMFQPQANTSFSISEVIQNSYISVDETGAEAAAATAILFQAQICCVSDAPPPMPVFFDADHPFIFAIRDTATNTILFLGRVTDPTTSDFSNPPAVAPTAPEGTGPGPITIGGLLPILIPPGLSDPLQSPPGPLAPTAPEPTPAAPTAPLPVAARKRNAGVGYGNRPAAIPQPELFRGVFASDATVSDLLLTQIGLGADLGEGLGALT